VAPHQYCDGGGLSTGMATYRIFQRQGETGSGPEGRKDGAAPSGVRGRAGRRPWKRSRRARQLTRGNLSHYHNLTLSTTAAFSRLWAPRRAAGVPHTRAGGSRVHQSTLGPNRTARLDGLKPIEDYNAITVAANKTTTNRY